MPRMTWTIPNSICKQLREEAMRRIRDESYAGSRPGTVERDIIVACYLLSFAKVKAMSKLELDKFLKGKTY